MGKYTTAFLFFKSKARETGTAETAHPFLPFLLKIDLKPDARRAVLEPRKPPRALKSGNPLTFSDFEGGLTPSLFELNSHPEFAKTYAYHLEISAKRRPLEEKITFFSRTAIRLTSFDSLPRYIIRKNRRTGNSVDFVEFVGRGMERNRQPQNTKQNTAKI